MKKIVSIFVVLLMFVSLCSSASALISPEDPGTEYSVVVYTTEGGSYTLIHNADGTITITGLPDDGHTFTGWLVDGDYEIVEGSLEDGYIVIRPLSDIKVISSFDGHSTPIIPEETTTGSGDGESTTVKKWTDSKNSPKTGDITAPLAACAVVALFGCGYCYKRSRENKE